MQNKLISTFCKELKKNFKNYNYLHKPFLDKKDYLKIKNTLDRNEVSTYGKNTKIFEKKLSNYLKTNYLISTVNGTSSLHAILNHLNVGSDDEVLVQSLTFVATVNPILYLGSNPHFIESCPISLAADPIKLENYLNSKKFFKKKNNIYNKQTKKRIRVLIITHIYGYPAELNKLKLIAKKFNLVLIEDAAETIGSSYKNKKLGTFGDFSFLSFNGNKTITTGAGGAIICKNKRDFIKIKHTITTSKLNNSILPNHDSMGFNYRMPSLNASLGLSQLQKISKILKAKNKIYKTYSLITKKFNDYFTVYKNDSKKNYNNNWIILLICKNKIIRNNLLRISKKHKINTRAIWKPMHKLKFLNKYPKMNLKVVNNLADRIICLPSTPNLNKKNDS